MVFGKIKKLLHVLPLAFALFTLPFFIAPKKAEASLTLYSWAFATPPNPAPENVSLRDIQTGDTLNGGINPINGLWVETLQNHNNNDSVLVTITDANGNNVAQTYDKGPSTTRPLPILYSYGHGLNIRNALCAREESLYAKCWIPNYTTSPTETIFGKFLSDSAGGPKIWYNIFFDGKRLSGFGDNRDFTIKMRCRDSSATSTGKIEHKWIDADTAQNRTLIYDPQPTNISITPTASWSETTEVGQTLQRSAEFENKTDLEKKIGTAQSDVNGSNIQNYTVALSPWHFPGSCTTETFSNWTPQRADTGQAIVNYTFIGDTQITKSETTFVRYVDVSPRIVAPETLEVNKPESLEVKVKNDGNVSVTPTVNLTSPFVATTSIPILPNDSVSVYFSWTPTLADSGGKQIKAVTITPNDYNPSNDTARKNIYVVYEDAQPINVTPTGQVTLGSSFTPTARVRNNGTKATAPFKVVYNIIDGKSAGEFTDTMIVSLQPHEEKQIPFREYTATATGLFDTEAKTLLQNDARLENDVFEGPGIEVVTFPIATWQRRGNIKTGVPGKGVKDGGSLTAVAESIYAFRGNRSNEFYRYYPENDEWEMLDSIYYGPNPRPPYMPSKKRIDKGSALCSGDNMTWAIRGKTKELWIYAANQFPFTWLLQDTIHPNLQRPFGGGTSLAYKDGMLYILAGGQRVGDPNFFSIRVSDNRITQLNSAPITPDGKAYKDGSDLAVLVNGSEHYIVAQKGGGKHNYVSFFNPATGLWGAQETIPKVHPAIHKKKLIKVGSSITSNGGILYETKGGGSNEFWERDTNGLWIPRDTVLRLNGKSVIKGGADLTYNQGYIYLLKGNNQLEFWRYGPLIPDGKSESRITVPYKEIFVPDNRLLVPKEGAPYLIKEKTFPKEQQVKLYNASGREVNRNDAERGVYFEKKGNSIDKIIIYK